MVNEKWDRFYLELAEFVANKLSRDPSTKVGAVLVHFREGIPPLEFIGYNGFPCGVNDSEKYYNDRSLKYPRVVHAEINAILKAGHYAQGSSLYVFPTFAIPNICGECAKVALQAGIKELIGWEPTDTEADRERRTRPRSDGSSWGDSISVSKQMFDQKGLIYRTIVK